MANSIQKDFRGPDWPLGFIQVAVPRTPVSIMSLVDPNSVNAPNAPQPPVAVGGIVTPSAGVFAYTPRGYRLIFQAFKPGAANGTQVNTGYVYVVRAGNLGAGNSNDYGSILYTLTPGQSWELIAGYGGDNMLNPYRYSIDGDTAGDGAFVTLISG